MDLSGFQSHVLASWRLSSLGSISSSQWKSNWARFPCIYTGCTVSTLQLIMDLQFPQLSDVRSFIIWISPLQRSSSRRCSISSSQVIPSLRSGVHRSSTILMSSRYIQFFCYFGSQICCSLWGSWRRTTSRFLLMYALCHAAVIVRADNLDRRLKHLRHAPHHRSRMNTKQLANFTKKSK